jgi:hypothetical protein
VIDLTHIEALVGPLPKGKEYEKLASGVGPAADPDDIFDYADGAVVEAYKRLERQARMLDAAWAIIDSHQPDLYTTKDDFIADLARRAEEAPDA